MLFTLAENILQVDFFRLQNKCRVVKEGIFYSNCCWILISHPCWEKNGLPWRQTDSGTNSHDPVDGHGAEILAGSTKFSHHGGGPRAERRGRRQQDSLQENLLLQAPGVPEQRVLPKVFGAEPAEVFFFEEEADQFRATRACKLCAFLSLSR